MADPVSSARWTGPPEAMSAPRRAVFTHRAGAPSATGDFAQLADRARAAAIFPNELRPVVRLAGLLLLSPIAFWLGTLILDAASNDWRVADRSKLLTLWGFGVAAVGCWQLTSRSLHFLRFRKAVLGLGILATIALAVGNVYLGLRSKAAAIASAPERTYEWHHTKGRGPFRSTTSYFQRVDGSFVNGRATEAPVEYGRTCALVERLDGPHGFSWVRVVERSRPRGRGELAWPIRREECFSDIPLSTLPR